MAWVMNMNIAFLGTAEFSRTVLQALLDEGWPVRLVISQPDHYDQRKRKNIPTAVKTLAEQHDIPAAQPEKIRNLELTDIDLIISAAYGQIVPEKILKIPPLGCVNVHASLLPKYRGGAPVHHAIMNGETRTGITLMYMVKKMDAGDILAQSSLDIGENENVGSLYERLAVLGGQLLCAKLDDIISGRITPQKQDEAQVITRADEHVSFAKSCQKVHDHIRGLEPWPGSYAVYEGRNIKLHQGRRTGKAATKAPGTIEKIDKSGLYIACEDELYCLEVLQIPGKRAMRVADYLNGGHLFETGGVMG